MKYYYVYMVECSDDTVYTGITNNLQRRLFEHNYGANDNSYTSKRRPVRIIWYQEFMQFEQAEMVEKRIKKWSRAKKIALAKDNFSMLHKLAECKNKTHFRYKPDNKTD